VRLLGAVPCLAPCRRPNQLTAWPAFTGCSELQMDVVILQVRAIYRVANPRLWGAYAQRCAEIVEELGAGEPQQNSNGCQQTNVWRVTLRAPHACHHTE
jgi:hypothetical protein